MSVYREELLLRSKDVDMFRRLRSSELFRLLQEASIRHTEQLGMGRDKTLDKGILWVLLMQRAEIARMPEYDERIVLKSWPGRTMHLLFPRYYSIETAAGEPLLKASAVWSLIDAKTRRVAKAECSLTRDFTVPYSFVDLNGHMNNTRYFDLAEDCVGEAERGRLLRSVSVEYQNEARLGEDLRLCWGGDDKGIFVCGQTDRPVFRMRLEYR